jgi:murein DD-endopeptidase MepM/ murein hydrolase activator NlpD
MKRRSLWWVFLVPIFVGCVLLSYQSESKTELTAVGVEGAQSKAVAEGAGLDSTSLFDGRFPRGSTIQDVLMQYSFSSEEVHQLIADTRLIYNLNRVREGNRYQIEFGKYGETLSFEYEISDEEALIAQFDGYSYQVIRKAVEFETVREHISGAISGSLWETLTELGEKEGLVMAMAEILQWDIDFTRVYEGDFFKLIVDKKFRHGELVKYGEIQAVQFNNAGKDFFGFRFVNPRDGKVGYFDQKGRSVRKAFLRVPFRFSPRISSGFSYNRLHPILKKRRPHLGLDFAAPKGTSVLASASGTVVVSGWNGGFGKFVKLRHGNGYQTSYGHLSRIRVKRGARVAQGQIIGNVGSTGLSTGAHLDYRVQDKRGIYLNPRKRIAWPSDRPVDKRYLDAYSAVRDGYSMQLEEGLYDQGKAEGFELAE